MYVSIVALIVTVLGRVGGAPGGESRAIAREPAEASVSYSKIYASFEKSSSKIPARVRIFEHLVHPRGVGWTSLSTPARLPRSPSAAPAVARNRASLACGAKARQQNKTWPTP